MAEKMNATTILAIGFGEGQTVVCTAVSSEGRLLGASTEKINPKEPLRPSERLRKFVARYRPSNYVIAADERAEELAKIANAVLNSPDYNAEIVQFKTGPELAELAASEWMTKNFHDLDAPLQRTFALGVIFLSPFSLITEIGARFFDLHPMQKIVNQDHLSKVIRRKLASMALRQGVKPREITESVFKQLDRIPGAILTEIRNRDIKEPFRSKADLKNVPGLTEVLYRNIAGYLTLGVAVKPLDCTIVHPFFYELLADAARQLGMSVEGIVVNPTALHSYSTDDFMTKLYIQKILIEQLVNGPKPSTQGSTLRGGKLRFDELQEGMVVSGTVTNITPFGVFVNINSICDGLIHISQLADAYVQSPDQVVAVNDRVNVRILKVDSKQRRISLSMKGLGPIGPKVKPSQNQLSTLVDHFSSR